MSRVITFSRVFPSYHPKAGQQTFFVEKVLNSLSVSYRGNDIPLIAANELQLENNRISTYDIQQFRQSLNPLVTDEKHTTIRAGKRWKAGDWFSPRVWGSDINPKSGRSGPYHSKQIQVAPDIQIKKTWGFETRVIRHEGELCLFGFINNELVTPETAEKLSTNDGLALCDFEAWFEPKKLIVGWPAFDGQIISWNENINY